MNLRDRLGAHPGELIVSFLGHGPIRHRLRMSNRSMYGGSWYYEVRGMIVRFHRGHGAVCNGQLGRARWYQTANLVHHSIPEYPLKSRRTFGILHDFDGHSLGANRLAGRMSPPQGYKWHSESMYRDRSHVEAGIPYLTAQRAGLNRQGSIEPGMHLECQKSEAGWLLIRCVSFRGAGVSRVGQTSYRKKHTCRSVSAYLSSLSISVGSSNLWEEDLTI